MVVISELSEGSSSSSSTHGHQPDNGSSELSEGSSSSSSTHGHQPETDNGSSELAEGSSSSSSTHGHQPETDNGSSDLSEGSSSSSAHDHNYDVFLSFRGEDTRHGFTDHLHKALLDANISTFLDDEEIETGEDLKPELESAIKSSRASIIVLSANYANSSWCLDELALILEQRMTSNHIVLPVFYHVEPADVRKQRNTFGDAFAKHKRIMEAETDANKRSQLAQKIDRWTKALTEVANIKGMDAEGRLETKFVEEVVKNIYLKLRVPLRSTLPLLIGMDDPIRFVTSWLKDDSSHKGDMITILGMGGIGKTSLAKYVYGLHSREFDTSSFIEDISRKCASHLNGLLDLQEQLYDDISKRSSIQVHDKSLYTSKIENVLARKKVFLVLDDIDSLDQLNALLGSKGFHPGSKIIITTRDARLIECCALLKADAKPEHAEYELKGLCEIESPKLLCFHAFASHKPKTGYEEVIKKIVKYCHGHPLALQVLGNSLYNMDVAYWEETIKRLTKESISDLNMVLRKSFDSLTSENDKELFKHIACFFVGIDRDVTETILNACGISTRGGITNLIDKCLLSIGPNNELVMDQLLQEMGRFIIREESPDKPWKRSRLCRHEESFKVLKHKKGIRNTVGLILDMRMLEKEKPGVSLFELETDALSNMEELMILHLNYVQMIGSYENFPAELRWLRMHGFPGKSIPLELRMENLVALDMTYSKIESFDISYTNPSRPEKRQKLNESRSKDKKLLGSLKILDLSFCEQLCRVGGFDGLHALERLILTNCIRLREVCESIEQCAELVLVDLSYCKSLRKLPRAIYTLKKVKTLLLDGCNLGESRINSGVNTKFSSSVVLESTPSDWKFFTTSLPRSLVSLSFENTNLSTESFPMDFSCLSMLKELCLDENPIVSLPNCVRNLPSLEILSMRNCNMLMTIENPPYKLAFLDLYSNSQHKPLLQKVVFVPNMSPLELSLGRKSLAPSSFEIEGMVKIQPMTNVEDKVLRGLGWTNLDFPDESRVRTDLLLRGPEESEIQMYYEFGIFSTIYGGEKMPNWIRRRSKGSSISFTIPSSHKNFRGLNFCSVQTSPFPNNDFLNLPLLRISNITKKQTWIYEHYIQKASVGGKCVTLLSHWMFGVKEMECGDHVTITVTEERDKVTKEWGVSFVYDDGKTDEEEDVLGYYKSWNHIIGGNLTGFELTTGEYILNNERFLVHGTEVNLHYCPLVGDGANFKDEVWFRAFSRRKTDIFGDSHERGSVQGGSASKRRHSSTTHHRLPSVKSHRRPSQLARTRRHPLLHRLHWQTILHHTRMRIQKRRVQRRSRCPPGHHGRIHS